MRQRTNGAGTSRPNLYREVTGKIIELLKTHELKWDKPWIVVKDKSLPHNADTNREYSGVNIILLSIEAMLNRNFRQGWVTFPQVKKLGGKVIKGEKASQIYFTDRFYLDKTNKKWKPDEVKDMTREQKKALDLKIIPFLVCYHVFNVMQTEGLPEKVYGLPENGLTKNVFEMDHEAEKFLRHSGAQVIEGLGYQPAYAPHEDRIYLPKRETFTAEQPFYQTAFHELAHWTGHPSRLNRMKTDMGKVDDKEYAFEELVAELTSAYLCAELGYSMLITNEAAYIKSWLKALESDVKFVFRASREAIRARRFIKELSAKAMQPEQVQVL